jgi:hypothetical protein
LDSQPVIGSDAPPSDSWTAGRSPLLPLPEVSFTPDAQPMRTRRVAILGFAETVKDAPVADPSWELWGMNGFWRAAEPDFGLSIPEERYALWFDMHTIEYTRDYGRRAGFGDAQERWLERVHPFPILMLDAAPEFPSVRAYPIADVIGAVGRDYFTSTVAYMIALAAAQADVAEIGLWGIDLAHDTEYADQRPCAEWHLAMAEARGIKVTTHARSALMRQLHRYGYEQENPLLGELVASLKIQEKQLVDAIAKHQAAQDMARMQSHTDDGALQMVRAMLTRLQLYQRGGRV